MLPLSYFIIFILYTPLDIDAKLYSTKQQSGRHLEHGGSGASIREKWNFFKRKRAKKVVGQR